MIISKLKANWLPTTSVIIILIICSIGLYFIVFTNSSPLGAYGFIGDEAVFIRGAERINDGQIPHLDFYTLIPGITFYILAFWFKLFGDSYLSAQFFNFTVIIIICILLIAIVWRFLRLYSMLLPLIFVFVLFPLWPFISHHWIFLLLIFIAINFIIYGKKAIHLYLAGAISAISIGVHHTKAVLVISGILIFLFLYSYLDMKRWQAVRIYLLGAISVLSLEVLMLILTGSWGEFFRQVIIGNFLYYPQLVAGVFLVINREAVSLLLSSLLFTVPLFWRKLIIDTHLRSIYFLLYFIYLALAFSVSYFLEPVHHSQIYILTIILASIIIFQTIRFVSLNKFEKKNYFFIYLIPLFLLVILVWDTSIFINNKHLTARNDGEDTRHKIETQKGDVFINDLWYSPVQRELPVVKKLVNTEYKNKQIFFLPYTPGYYYFFGLTNPTSFDILPTDKIAQLDISKLINELSNKTDVVFYLPSSWPGFSVEGEIMTWITENFSIKKDYLEGSIKVYSKTAP